MVNYETGMAARVETAQLNALFARARFVYLVNAINAAIVAAFLWDVTPAATLLGWTMAVWGLSAVRFRQLLEYEKDDAKAEHLTRWKRIAIWGAGLSGLAWGSAMLLLYPQGALLQQMFLVMVCIGMMAGSVTTWYAWFPAFLAYFLPVAAFTLSRMLFVAISGGADRSMFAALSAVFVVFGASLFVFARKSNGVLEKLLLTQFEKEASEDRYRSLFLGARTPMMLIDPSSGTIVDSNGAAADYYGYPLETMKGMNIAQINTLPYGEIAGKMSRADGGNECCFLFKHRLAGGEMRDVEVRSGPVILGGRRLLYSIVQDVTERTRAEQLLRRETAKTMEVFKVVSDGLHILDSRGHLQQASDSFCRMLGYTQDEMAGMNVLQWDVMLHPEVDFAVLVDGIPDEGRSLETRHRRKDGMVLDVEIHAAVAVVDGEKFVYASAHDISERKRTERLLREREADLNAVLDNMPQLLWLKDADGRYLTANRHFLQTAGLDSAEQVRGRTDYDIWPRELAEKYCADDAEVMATRRQKFVEEKALDGDREYWVETFKTPIIDADGKVLGTSGYARDITERKRAEEEIARTRQIMESDRLLFQTILDNAPLGLWFLGADGRMQFVNRTFCEAVGIPEQRFLSAAHYSDVLPESIAASCMKSDAECLAQDSPHLSMEWLPFVDGSEHLLEIIKVRLPGTQGKIKGLIGLAMDMTERKQAEESMRLASLVFQASNEAIMVTDENNRIIEINPAFTRITGYTLDEVDGKGPKVLSSGLHDREFYAQMWDAIVHDGCWQGEIWDRRKSGELFAKWTSISAIRNADGSVYRYVGQFSDITEKKQKDELIWKQANHDMLTGLPNRRLFRDRLEREIKKSHRSGLPLALLFIDLDRFKEVNDTLGHDMGDRLLVEAALRISQCVRETDTVARLGGDEFTVILSEFGNRAQLERIAQHIISGMNEPFLLDNEIAYVSASIGLTIYPDDATELEGLLKNADQAMYGAKKKGRNRFGYFTESMQSEAQEKISLTNDLRLALTFNELEVYFQPIVEMASGRIVKAEALLRWKHSKRGMINPDTFIPLAEESGLIMEIGEWVFHEAAACVERWRAKFGSIIPVSVNKSPAQFSEASGGEWPGQLEKLGLPGNSIGVEVTESMLLDEVPGVRQRLLTFRNGGMEISMDDFGTGYSSLSRLRQFDIDYLKIDRSFVSNLADNENDKALVEAIIAMAHKLAIRTIAEGVETERQRELLALFGCDLAQGFLYSRPVPALEFEKLLEKESMKL